MLPKGWDMLPKDWDMLTKLPKGWDMLLINASTLGHTSKHYACNYNLRSASSDLMENHSPSVSKPPINCFLSKNKSFASEKKD